MAGPGQDHAFAREEVYPSWFANRIQDMLSAGKFDLVLSRKNATTIQVVPDAILGIAAVNIKGRWRFNTGAVERVVTGAKATYGIWAVAEDNSVNNTPNPFTDHTVYTFELRVSVAEPSVGAGTAIAMKIGEVDWSGTEIEKLRQNRGAVTGALLADGTFTNSTQIEWVREPSGAMVPSIIKESIAEDRLNAALLAKLQASGVAGHFESHGAALTRTSTSLGAFSTPVKVVLPKVAVGQVIEVVCSGYVKDSIESTNTQGAMLQLEAAGVVAVTTTPLGLPSVVPANTFKLFNIGNGAVVTYQASGVPNDWRGRLLEPNASGSPTLRFIAANEGTNVAVELKGASFVSGTITVENVYLAARVWG